MKAAYNSLMKDLAPPALGDGPSDHNPLRFEHVCCKWCATWNDI